MNGTAGNFERTAPDGAQWLRCPHCGGKLLKRLPTTEARDLPLYCKRCKRESILNIERQRP